MGPTFKKYCRRLACTTQAASIESISLHTFVVVARRLLWRGARLDAIGPIGQRPALHINIDFQSR